MDTASRTSKSFERLDGRNGHSRRDLGVYGEQILLAVRYGDWIAINDEDSAKNWAAGDRVEGYLHAPGPPPHRS